jgi:hypothetical protein
VVLSSRRYFREVCLFKDAETDQLDEPLGEYLGRKTFCRTLELPRSADTVAYLVEDVERPFAAKAILNDLGDAEPRSIRGFHDPSIYYQMVATLQKSARLIDDGAP